MIKLSKDFKVLWFYGLILTGKKNVSHIQKRKQSLGSPSENAGGDFGERRDNKEAPAVIIRQRGQFFDQGKGEKI